MTSVPTPSDRRSQKRYAIKTDMRYRAANGPLNAAWKNGRVLNMSACGILIEVPDSPAVGTKLELAMDWTGLYHGRQNMRLFLIASVSRADSRGVALRILSNRFRDVSPFRFQRAQTAVA